MVRRADWWCSTDLKAGSILPPLVICSTHGSLLHMMRLKTTTDRPKGKKKKKKELLNDEMPRTVHRNLLLYVLYGKVSSSIFLPFSLKSLRPPSFFLFFLSWWRKEQPDTDGICIALFSRGLNTLRTMAPSIIPKKFIENNNHPLDGF